MTASVAETTWLAVLDGKKALVFYNEGFDDAPNLKLVFEEFHEDPPNRELHDDRAGHFPAGRGPGGDSTEESDRHAQIEAAFVADIADKLDAAATAGRFDRIVILADPKTMGRLRTVLSEAVRARIRAEKLGDHVREPMKKIEAAFLAALAEAR